jgi:hypothetical protein
VIVLDGDFVRHELHKLQENPGDLEGIDVDMNRVGERKERSDAPAEEGLPTIESVALGFGAGSNGVTGCGRKSARETGDRRKEPKESQDREIFGGLEDAGDGHTAVAPIRCGSWPSRGARGHTGKGRPTKRGMRYLSGTGEPRSPGHDDEEAQIGCSAQLTSAADSGFPRSALLLPAICSYSPAANR